MRASEKSEKGIGEYQAARLVILDAAVRGKRTNLNTNPTIGVNT